ncbi:MAG: hypothetical protein AAF591_10770 [Verrucomicrobiota bacterium]
MTVVPRRFDLPFSSYLRLSIIHKVVTSVNAEGEVCGRGWRDEKYRGSAKTQSNEHTTTRSTISQSDSREENARSAVAKFRRPLQSQSEETSPLRGPEEPFDPKAEPRSGEVYRHYNELQWLLPLHAEHREAAEPPTSHAIQNISAASSPSSCDLLRASG